MSDTTQPQHVYNHYLIHLRHINTLFPLQELRLTLREMIMALHSKGGSKHLFVSVDRNTYNENIKFTSPMKYYEEAQNRMVEIEPYHYK